MAPERRPASGSVTAAREPRAGAAAALGLLLAARAAPRSWVVLGWPRPSLGIRRWRLADLGPPDQGRASRGSPPGARPGSPREAALSSVENRGKYSVVAARADLTAGGWLAPLVASADAIVEDLGPGRLEATGLSPDALHARNPRLAILRISPFGQTGPLAGERGDDRIAQAFSGVQFTTGFPDRPPIPVALPLLDCWTGVLGANGLLMAIFHARRSGRGQVVDLGLYQIACACMRRGSSSLTAARGDAHEPSRLRVPQMSTVPATGDGCVSAPAMTVRAPLRGGRGTEAPKDRVRHARRAAEHRAAPFARCLLDRPHDLAEVERASCLGVRAPRFARSTIHGGRAVLVARDLLSLSSETGLTSLRPRPCRSCRHAGPESVAAPGSASTRTRCAPAPGHRAPPRVGRRGRSAAGAAVGLARSRNSLLDLSQCSRVVSATILSELARRHMLESRARRRRGSHPPPAFASPTATAEHHLDCAPAGARGLPRLVRVATSS